MDRLWLWIDAHGAIVYPLIAAAVIGLIVWTVLKSWRAHELGAEEKARLKGEIIRMLRARLHGVTAETVAAELGLDRFRAAALLAEMKEEGMLSESTLTTGVTTYRLKGL